VDLSRPQGTFTRATSRCTAYLLHPRNDTARGDLSRVPRMYSAVRARTSTFPSRCEMGLGWSQDPPHWRRSQSLMFWKKVASWFSSLFLPTKRPSDSRARVSIPVPDRCIPITMTGGHPTVFCTSPLSAREDSAQGALHAPESLVLSIQGGQMTAGMVSNNDSLDTSKSSSRQEFPAARDYARWDIDGHWTIRLKEASSYLFDEYRDTATKPLCRSSSLRRAWDQEKEVR
jgi:hypothetical protein